MKSIKLTNDMKEKITFKLTKLKFNSSIEEVENELLKELEIQLLKENNFPIVPDNLTNYVKTSDNVRIYIKERKTRSFKINKRYVIPFHVYEFEIKQINNKIIKLYEKFENLRDESINFKNKTSILLNSFNTTKQLIENIPELESIITELYGNENIILNHLIPIEKINEFKKQILNIKLN